MAAEVPSVKPDILIVESTYGTHIHEKREVNNFTKNPELCIIRGEGGLQSWLNELLENSVL